MLAHTCARHCAARFGRCARAARARLQRTFSRARCATFMPLILDPSLVWVPHACWKGPLFFPLLSFYGHTAAPISCLPLPTVPPSFIFVPGPHLRHGMPCLAVRLAFCCCLLAACLTSPSASSTYVCCLPATAPHTPILTICLSHWGGEKRRREDLGRGGGAEEEAGGGGRGWEPAASSSGQAEAQHGRAAGQEEGRGKGKWR